MKIGSEVTYKGSTYTVSWVYDIGYCELSSDRLDYVIVVKSSDVKIPVKKAA
jgi:hypothetical protein